MALSARLVAIGVCAAMSGAARAEPRLWLGGAGGVSLQSDQYVLGPQMSLRGLAVPFFDLRARVLAGLGPDYLTLHVAAHASLRLEIKGFRLFGLAGASAYGYRSRGAFDSFCQKAQIDCGGTAAGFDFGLGVGWRAFEVDVVIGTGDLPLWTFTGGVSFGL